MKKTLITFITFIIFITVISSIHAQDKKPDGMFRVSPAVLQLSLSPGKVETYEITIENLQDIPLPLSAGFEDFDTDDNGELIFTANNPNSLRNWVRLDKTETIIPPKEKTTFSITLNFPRSIPFGGYYSMLFFQPKISSSQIDETAVVAKVGVLLMANIGINDLDKKEVQITEWQIEQKIYEENPTSFRLAAQNISIANMTAKPILNLKPLIGKGIEINLEEKFIFPGKTRKWNETLTNISLMPGYYTAQIRVATGGGYSVTKDTWFIIFPYRIGAIISITILTSYILTKKRKRFPAFFKALTEK